MPNQKAEKIELKLPPFLSLSHGEFTIDDTMSKLEENNAPFINERLQPLYKREIAETKPVIYDKNGNQYKIENSFFTKNGVNLFRVASKKFVREDVSDTFSGYLSYDIDENDKVAYSTFDYSTNRVSITYDGITRVSNPLFNEGTIIEARTKIIDGDPYTIVVYKDEGNNLFFMISDFDVSYFDYKSITWKASRIRRGSTNTYSTFTVTDINQEYPLIQIAKVYDNVIGISFVNEYSSVMTSLETAYSTWFLYQGTLYELGNSLIPSNTTIPKQVTTTTQVYFHVHVTRQATIARGDCILVNNKWHDYTGQVVGEELDFPEGYVPALTGSATIDDVTYTTGTWRRYDAISAVLCVTNDNTINYTFKVNGITAPTEIPNQVVLVNSNYFNTEYAKIEKMEIVWQSETTEIPISYLERNYLIERTSTTLQTVSYLAYPNVVLDNGNMYTMFRFIAATSSWANSLSAGNYIVESGKVSGVSLASSVLTYTITSLEEVAITSNYNNVRSNSYSVGQNFFQSTVKLNNSASPTPEALQAGTATDEAKNNQRFLEYTNSNCYNLSYFPGTNRLSDRNYYDSENNTGPGEDLAVFTSIGGRCQLSNSPFNALYNTFISGISTIQGISYSESNEQMGTLLTEWQSVDGDSYIAVNSHSVIYRDKNNKIWKISIVDAEPELMTVFDDTFILINTTSFWNSFDTKSNKKFHYATDYNDRAVAGEKSVPSDLTSYKDAYVRMRISAINAAFRSIPRYQVCSEILKVNTVLRCSTNFQSYNCECPEDRDTQGIDVYFSDRGNSTLPRYRFTIYPYGYTHIDVVAKNSDLIGTSYVSNDNVLISPNIFTKFINGAGNNDMVKEGWTNYALTYYQDRPFFLYSTGTELDEVQHFFVIQGQFYAIINDKIYSVIYTNGVITELEAIVDIRDFVFIGNTPSIAFFWSPSYRAFYSFHGDANMEFLFPGNKFSEIKEDYCFYDEATQTIYASTDRGLLVFGPKNTYLLYDITNVKNIQFTNDHITHIITDGTIYDFCFYPRDGFASNNVKLETEFMGIGNTTSTTIDRWSITIQTEDITKESWIKVGVRSITDVTVKSEEKIIPIKPSDWDKWSKCVLVNFNPQLIKGQGIRLYLETPDSVCHIVGHIMNNGGSTLSRHTA